MINKALKTTPIKSNEIIYKRRNYYNPRGDVTRCTDITISDIIQTGEIGCIGAPGDTCTWEGQFIAEVFNNQGDITYEWSVDIGSIQGSDATQICIIWVSAESDTLINVTCTVVSTDNGSSTITKEFKTNHGGSV